jgi:fructuronate reductase
MAAGLPGVTVLSCDNLADNGRQVRGLLLEFLMATNPALADWFADHCCCPGTMVDRIVPAMTVADRALVAGRIGLEDQGAVITEGFSQWVIEDDFAGPRPRWEQVGAQLVGDVRPHEAAKLRMLNGAHSALAYLGLERGHDYVHQAIADPAIASVVNRLMRIEAAATLDADTSIDAGVYADRLIERFANSALRHRLQQIAKDGSQKIPQRWLEPMDINQAAGRQSPATLTALAAWCRHVQGPPSQVDDPMSASLAQLWQSQGIQGGAAALFGPQGLFARAWTASPAELGLLCQRIGDAGSP